MTTKRVVPIRTHGEWPELCAHRFGHEAETVALVLGSAPCVNDDAAAALELLAATPDVIAINRAGIRYSGPVQHWVSIHGEKLFLFRARRDELGYPQPAVCMAPTCLPPDRAPHFTLWANGPRGGSSALLAAAWALFWGYRRVILCGCPLTGAEALFDDGSVFTDSCSVPCEGYRAAWTAAMLKGLPLARHVRSMSGWTRGLLGEPTPEWLA